jgi:hypothetical protein
MTTYEKAQRRRHILAHYAGSPGRYSGVPTGLVSTLFPGTRRRTQRRAHELSWVAWFLLIGWWAVPTILVTWLLWATIKFTILGTVEFIKLIKEVKHARS